MVDKVEVTFQDFKVADRPKLFLRPAKVDLQTGQNRDEFALWTQANGDILTGSGAHRNTDLASIDIDARGLKVSFCPAKVCHGNNYYKVQNSGELNASFKTVAEIVKDTGIQCDFESGTVCRLDLAKDKEMDEPFQIYRQLFCMLEAKRAKPRDIGESYYFGNRTRQVSFYDKVHEMADKGLNIGEFGLINKNVMRCELRLTGAKPVAKYSGMVDIKTLSNADAFNNLSSTYNSVIADFVFRQKDNGGQMRFNFMREVETLMFFKSTYRRNSIQRYKAFKGIENIFQEFGNIDNFKTLLLQAGYERTYVFREVRELQRQISAVIQIDEKYKNKRTVQSLYDEVYTKMLAA